jgi:hypothetical protein
MSRENLIMIGYIALIVVVIVVVRFIAHAVINKGADAVHNAIVRSKEKEPPKQESLADKYGNREE